MWFVRHSYPLTTVVLRDGLQIEKYPRDPLAVLALELVLVLVLVLVFELAARFAIAIAATELHVLVAFAAILGDLAAPVALVPFAAQLDCYALVANPVARLEIADLLARLR